MYLIRDEMVLTDAIDFAYGNGLSIAPRADMEVGGESFADSEKKYDR